MTREVSITLIQSSTPVTGATVTLSDATATYGIREAVSNDVVVAAGTAVPHVGSGVYRYDFTDAAGETAYEATLKVVWPDGSIEYYDRPLAAVIATTLPSMLTLERAKALIADLPDVTRTAALSDDALTKRLAICSRRVNTAHRWQGRKYDPAQVWEFPRVLHGPHDVTYPSFVVDYSDVADWDYDTDAAIIPLDVELAVIYEIESHEDGSMARVLGKIASGISAQSTGGLSVTYNTAMYASGRPRLCPKAGGLVSRFILTSGGLL
jgi:hypothetical protein